MREGQAGQGRRQFGPESHPPPALVFKRIELARDLLARFAREEGFRLEHGRFKGLKAVQAGRGGEVVEEPGPEAEVGGGEIAGAWEEREEVERELMVRTEAFWASSVRPLARLCVLWRTAEPAGVRGRAWAGFSGVAGRIGRERNARRLATPPFFSRSALLSYRAAGSGR